MSLSPSVTLLSLSVSHLIMQLSLLKKKILNQGLIFKTVTCKSKTDLPSLISVLHHFPKELKAYQCRVVSFMLHDKFEEALTAIAKDKEKAESVSKILCRHKLAKNTNNCMK